MSSHPPLPLPGFRLLLLLSMLWILWGGKPAAWAEVHSLEHPNSITLQWENDFIANTDRDYTNGLRLAWSRHLRSPGEQVGPASMLNFPLIDRLAFVQDPFSHVGVTVSLGHSIYTPVDTRRAELIEDDRPYAGYLYVGTGLYGLREDRLTLMELTLGLIGPLAQGEEMQNAAHRVVGSTMAQGWASQLGNEPAFTLSYETRWRWWEQRAGHGWGMQMIPYAGARLGNVATDATLGAETRLGWHLPGSLGTCPIRTGCDSNHLASLNPTSFGFHLFWGLQGSLVLRDIFLDGNTFSSSHRVSKEPFVAEAYAGLGLRYGRFRASYCYILRTRQFEEQERNQVFGSLTFSFDY